VCLATAIRNSGILLEISVQRSSKPLVEQAVVPVVLDFYLEGHLRDGPCLDYFVLRKGWIRE